MDISDDSEKDCDDLLGDALMTGLHQDEEELNKKMEEDVQVGADVDEEKKSDAVPPKQAAPSTNIAESKEKPKSRSKAIKKLFIFFLSL